MSGFSPQQQDALEKAYNILGEHFDGSLMVVVADCGDDEPQEATRIYWHGGRTQALGLAEEAKNRILNRPPDEVRQ